MGGYLQGGRRYLGGENLKGEFLKVSMIVDLTSDDEGGFNGEDGDEEVVFVEPVEPPKADARAPGGRQQGLAQIMQSARGGKNASLAAAPAPLPLPCC